nr:unnamed protein product [Callosobruchus chinensis]
MALKAYRIPSHTKCI